MNRKSPRGRCPQRSCPAKSRARSTGQGARCDRLMARFVDEARVRSSVFLAAPRLALMSTATPVVGGECSARCESLSPSYRNSPRKRRTPRTALGRDEKAEDVVLRAVQKRALYRRRILKDTVGQGAEEAEGGRLRRSAGRPALGAEIAHGAEGK